MIWASRVQAVVSSLVTSICIHIWIILSRNLKKKEGIAFGRKVVNQIGYRAGYLTNVPIALLSRFFDTFLIGVPLSACSIGTLGLSTEINNSAALHLLQAKWLLSAPYASCLKAINLNAPIDVITDEKSFSNDALSSFGVEIEKSSIGYMSEIKRHIHGLAASWGESRRSSRGSIRKYNFQRSLYLVRLHFSRTYCDYGSRCRRGGHLVYNCRFFYSA